jgi:hypothetical protein
MAWDLGLSEVDAQWSEIWFHIVTPPKFKKKFIG